MRDRWPGQVERPLSDMVATEVLNHPHYGPVYLGGTVTGQAAWAAWGENVSTVRIQGYGTLDRPYASVPGRFMSEHGPVRVHLDGEQYEFDQRFPHALLPTRGKQAHHATLAGRRYIYRPQGAGGVLVREGTGVVMYTLDRKPQTKGVVTPLADTIDTPLGFVVDRAIGPDWMTVGDFVEGIASLFFPVGPIRGHSEGE